MHSLRSLLPVGSRTVSHQITQQLKSATPCVQQPAVISSTRQLSTSTPYSSSKDGGSSESYPPELHKLLTPTPLSTPLSRPLSLSSARGKCLNQPTSGNDLARCAGITTMFRLPLHSMDTTDLDACFVGVPIDWGVSNRPGTRFGPRQIRTEATLIRRCNSDTGASPFDSIHVADCGDVSVTPYDLTKTVTQIYQQFQQLLSSGCKVLALGGDHTITYPILKAYKELYGPVGLIHIDAHQDCNEHMNDCKLSHGTTFRRAYEDGCLDPERVVQIGIRGSSYSVHDSDWTLSMGFRIVRAQSIYNQSLIPLMAEVREQMGDKPVYISFDIDGLDPSIAPGTGTPEIAGLNSMQALEIIRGCRGLNIVGGDLVEVSPPYDPSGNTALTAANLLFEMLCVLPGVQYQDLP